MNGFYLMGRIISEPERGETANGTRYCRLKISVDKNARDQEETSEIYEIAVFRNLAENEYKIDQNIGVCGKLQANNYEKDGVQYCNVRLLGNTVCFV